MKSVGIIKEIDNLGRIVIPKEMRELFGLEKRVAERDPVEPRQKRLFSAPLTESLLAILSMAASSLSQNHLKISVFGACNFRRANLGLIKAKKRRQL